MLTAHGHHTTSGPPGPPDREPWQTALERLDGAYAGRTLQGYAADFAIFAAWCRTAELEFLPATATTLSRFVEAQSGKVAPRTVARRLAAIRKVHRVIGLGDETRHEAVAIALRRALRLHGRRPRQALGLSAALRDRLLGACPATLKGARDRALIAIGYDTLCRRSELVALHVEDLIRLPDGGAKVLIRRAKNDPFSEGEYAYISRAGLAHLQAWLEQAAIHDGHLFRPIFKTSVGRTGLDPRTVNRVLHAAADLAGCDPSLVRRLTAHSLRVGPAQDLAIAGYSASQIMRAGRWRNLDAISTYIRLADVNVWSQPSTRPHRALEPPINQWGTKGDS